jgi:hypothetical protein
VRDEGVGLRAASGRGVYYALMYKVVYYDVGP